MQVCVHLEQLLQHLLSILGLTHTNHIILLCVINPDISD